jgi:hypothetical protein
MNDLQMRLNNCLRKALVFNYMGKEVKAQLNLTDGLVNVLTIGEGSTVEEFARIEKYLRDEGFFD